MLGYKVNFYYLTCIASTAGAKLDLTNRVCQHFQSPTGDQAYIALLKRDS